MNTNVLLASRLREVFLDGKWIANTNYKDQLEGIPWDMACKQHGNLNSIAKLTFHINYYLKGLLDAFATGKLTIRDKFSFDMPAMSSEQEWQRLKHELEHHATQFALMVEQMDVNDFDKPFIDEKYGSLRRNIEGVIEHSYYHLGQIVLLSRILKSTT